MDEFFFIVLVFVYLDGEGMVLVGVEFRFSSVKAFFGLGGGYVFVGVVSMETRFLIYW